MLFSNQKKHHVSLPVQDEAGNASSIAYLIRYLCDNVMRDPKKELFVLDDHV